MNLHRFPHDYGNPHFPQGIPSECQGSPPVAPLCAATPAVAAGSGRAALAAAPRWENVGNTADATNAGEEILMGYQWKKHGHMTYGISMEILMDINGN